MADDGSGGNGARIGWHPVSCSVPVSFRLSRHVLGCCRFMLARLEQTTAQPAHDTGTCAGEHPSAPLQPAACRRLTCPLLRLCRRNSKAMIPDGVASVVPWFCDFDRGEWMRALPVRKSAHLPLQASSVEWEPVQACWGLTLPPNQTPNVA